MGAPGSGKDTQVKELQKHFKLQPICSGDIARHVAENNPEMEKIIDEGHFLPDEIFLKSLEALIARLPKDTGFILDGFPRTLKQEIFLRNLLFHIGKTVENVIYLYVPESKLVERISKRFFCPKCNYVSSFAQEKTCPKCASSLERRADDNPAAVTERISLYLEKTIPVIEYYKSKSELIEINGDQDVENVTRDILNKLKA